MQAVKVLRRREVLEANINIEMSLEEAIILFQHVLVPAEAHPVLIQFSAKLHSAIHSKKEDEDAKSA